MFSTLITAIGSRLRLYVEYALVAAVVGLGCAAVAFYWKTQALEVNAQTLHTQVDDLNGQVRNAVAANAQQEKAINDLVVQRAQDALAVQSLTSQFNVIQQHDASTRARLNDLVKNNANVRNYFATPLPTELRGVLNGTGNANGNGDAGHQGDTASNPAAAVQPTHAATTGYDWRSGRRLASVEIGCATVCGPHGCGYRLVQA